MLELRQLRFFRNRAAFSPREGDVTFREVEKDPLRALGSRRSVARGAFRLLCFETPCLRTVEYGPLDPLSNDGTIMDRSYVLRIYRRGNSAR